MDPATGELVLVQLDPAEMLQVPEGFANPFTSTPVVLGVFPDRTSLPPPICDEQARRDLGPYFTGEEGEIIAVRRIR